MSTGAAPRVTLADGRTFAVRPIERTDTEALKAMHRRLSPTSVVRRFFTALPELGDDQATRFCDVDGFERAALVAVGESGDLLGVARYDRLPGTGDAEVAVVVRDDHQHHGLGTSLLRLLVERARECGVQRFSADVLADNGRMFATFRDAGLDPSATTYDHGVVHVVLPLAASVAVPARRPADGPLLVEEV